MCANSLSIASFVSMQWTYHKTLKETYSFLSMHVMMKILRVTRMLKGYGQVMQAPPIITNQFEVNSGSGTYSRLIQNHHLEGLMSNFPCRPSPKILHHTVWRTWLFITYSDERWLYYQFLLPHLYNHLSLGRLGGCTFFNLGVKGLTETFRLCIGG